MVPKRLPAEAARNVSVAVVMILLKTMTLRAQLMQWKIQTIIKVVQAAMAVTTMNE